MMQFLIIFTFIVFSNLSTASDPIYQTWTDFNSTLVEIENKRDPNSLYQMAQFHEFGVKDFNTHEWLQEPNKLKAFNIYKDAYNSGSLKAGYNLGLMYYNGEGVKRNIPKAQKYLKPYQSKLSAKILNDIFNNSSKINIHPTTINIHPTTPSVNFSPTEENTGSDSNPTHFIIGNDNTVPAKINIQKFKLSRAPSSLSHEQRVPSGTIQAIVSLKKRGSIFCTGALLENNLILTARHCLEVKQFNRVIVSISGITVSISEIGDFPLKRIIYDGNKYHKSITEGQEEIEKKLEYERINKKLTERALYNKYFQSYSKIIKKDWVLLELDIKDQSLLSEVEKFKFPNEDEFELIEKTIHTGGYPLDKQELYYDKNCKIFAYGKLTFLHNCDILKGQSGSPIFEVNKKGDLILYGIVSLSYGYVSKIRGTLTYLENGIRSPLNRYLGRNMGVSFKAFKKYYK